MLNFPPPFEKPPESKFDVDRQIDKVFDMQVANLYQDMRELLFDEKLPIKKAARNLDTTTLPIARLNLILHRKSVGNVASARSPIKIILPLRSLFMVNQNLGHAIELVHISNTPTISTGSTEAITVSVFNRKNDIYSQVDTAPLVQILGEGVSAGIERFRIPQSTEQTSKRCVLSLVRNFIDNSECVRGESIGLKHFSRLPKETLFFPAP